jgi:hypothetical protein
LQSTRKKHETAYGFWDILEAEEKTSEERNGERKKEQEETHEKKKLWFRYGGDLSDGGLKASAHMPITTGVVTQECEAHQDGEADGDLRPDHHTSSSSCLHRFSLCSSCKTTILFSSSSVSSRLVIFCRLCKLTTVPLGTQNLPQGVQRP